MRPIFICVIVVLLAGCANFTMSLIEQRKVVSSGQIGCKPSEIDIQDNERYTWTAICKNKSFYCTIAQTASCKEEVK